MATNRTKVLESLGWVETIPEPSRGFFDLPYLVFAAPEVADPSFLATYRGFTGDSEVSPVLSETDKSC